MPAARRPSFCCIQIFSAVVASLWHLLATATAWGVAGVKWEVKEAAVFSAVLLLPLLLLLRATTSEIKCKTKQTTSWPYFL